MFSIQILLNKFKKFLQEGQAHARYLLHNQRGQASRLLLVLAIVVLVAVIIVFLVMKMIEPPAPPGNNIPGTNPNPVLVQVYETELNAVRFVFESAIDRGIILRSYDIQNKRFDPKDIKDLIISNTGAKFIQVTVGAQNKGIENTEKDIWDIGNIVDSEGRNFVPLESNIVNPWLPEPNLCGILLKPAFDPTPCTKIYEVAKASTGLRIQVKTIMDRKTDVGLVDLIVK